MKSYTRELLPPSDEADCVAGPRKSNMSHLRRRGLLDFSASDYLKSAICDQLDFFWCLYMRGQDNAEFLLH